MATYLLNLLNPSAELGTTSWDTTGSVLTKNSDPLADVNSEGDFYWYSDTEGFLGQTVAVNSEVLTAIDNNSGFVGIQFAYGNLTTPRGSGLRVIVKALNSSGAVLSTAYDSTFLVGSDEDSWYRVNTLATLNSVPANTRFFRVEVTFGDGVNPSAGMLDDMFLYSSDGQFTTIRISGLETNVLFSKESSLNLDGFEVYNASGEGARVYEDAMRISGIEANVLYSRPGILNLDGFEVYNASGEGAKSYENGIRISGIETNVIYSRPGILNLDGFEAYYAMGKASNLDLLGFEVYIASSVKQKYTPIVTVLNEIPEETYIKTNAQGICYEQPVRG